MPPCKASVHFDSERDIPPLDGKVILVTGGNNGLGKQCVLEYARHNPAEIWLAARNLDKAQAAVDDIQAQLKVPVNIKLLELDLSSLASVQRAAEAFKAKAARLDILMLNAGIMSTPPGLTTDGYEVQVATNYLGHALFAKLLLPVLNHTGSMPGADVRVVMLSSDAHRWAPKGGIVFNTLKTTGDTLSAMERYGQSKVMEILWVRKMARLHPRFTFASVHPGIVSTNLQAGATGVNAPLRIFMKVNKNFLSTVDKGVRNQLWASVSHDVVSGEYYVPVGEGGHGSTPAKDHMLMETLWTWTERELAHF